MSRKKAESPAPQDLETGDSQVSQPPVQNKGAAAYVMASGAQYGQSVPVAVGEQKPYPDGIRADLFGGEDFDKKVQTLALHSDKKEPGTWHWV